MSQTATTYTQSFDLFSQKINDGLNIFAMEWWVWLTNGYIFDRGHVYQDVELFLIGVQKTLVNVRKEDRGNHTWVLGADDAIWQASPKIEADGAVFGVGQEAYLCSVFGSKVTAINGPFTLGCKELIERRLIEG